MKQRFALLAVFGLLAGLLLASLRLAADDAPVRADEPAQTEGIPRHRVGHRSKVRDMDALLAQGDGGDPLAGNYRLALDEEIFAVFRDSRGILNSKYYNIDANLDTIETIRTLYSDGDGPAVATGNFNGDPLDDFVRVRRRSSELYMMLGYFQDGIYDVTYGFDTGEKGGSLPRVATGDFDGDGQDETVMAWEGSDDWANLKVYDPQGSIHPGSGFKLYDEKIANGNLDVATGDFDGDGMDEVALAWIDLGNAMAVKVYDVAQDGTITAKSKWRGEGGRTAAVATGDFNGDGVDEITAVDGEYLRIFQVSNKLDTLTAKSRQSWNCSGGDDPSVFQVDVAAGDFDTDAQDEIVSTCHEGQGVLLYVWASGSDLGLAHKADWSKEVEYTREGTLAIGDLNHDLHSEIVLAWTQWDDLWYPEQQHDYVQVLQVAKDLGSITAKGQVDLGEAPARSHIAVALGDLDGDSFRVGPPTYQYMQKAVQNLAVINAPPKHRDVINGQTYDVNVTDRCTSPTGPPCTFARYETSQETTTKMSLTTTRDWGVSAELDLKAPFVKTSLEASYGQSFEKTTSAFKTMAFGQAVEADQDDEIVRTQQELDVWEYPVYASDSDVVEGHILVAWPRKVDPTCTSNCSADVINTLAGRSVNSLYRPNHQYGNVLSYSIEDPANISVTIKADTERELDGDSWEWWVVWSDVNDEEDKKSSELDLKASLELKGWGQKLKTTGTYSQGEVSLHKISFETETKIHLYIFGIDDQYSYSVRPFLYWAEPDGHLVLDYVVAPVTASPPTWWQNTYDKPDPAFNLAWKGHNPTPSYELLSKEIIFEPYSPTAGEMVTITAKVRNYSLVSTDNVAVQLYLGDPDQGGTQIGAEQNIPELRAMSSQTVTVHFDSSGHGGQELDIYAVIPPAPNGGEMHEDNNKAYAILPVKPVEDHERPANLALVADGIAFEPETAAAGTTVQISATVEAQGRTFTHVLVEFWDGDPRQGGQVLGADLIPMILAGQRATARFAWDTAGEHGAREIWVSIDHRAGDEDIYGDNWAHETLNLAPYHQYLPLVGRGP